MSLFNYNLGILREKTPAGADAILRQDPHHWSRAWFKLGHNRSTCEKRTGSTSGSTRQSAPPPTDSVSRVMCLNLVMVYALVMCLLTYMRHLNFRTWSTHLNKALSVIRRGRQQQRQVQNLRNQRQEQQFKNVSHQSAIHILTTYAIFLTSCLPH